MINAGIIGATGYAGAELVRILAGHPEVKLRTITSRQYADRDFTDIYPSMTGKVDLVCEECNILPKHFELRLFPLAEIGT